MGHQYGDRVLKKLAIAVRKQLRAVDVLARYGGDEFVLVLPGTAGVGAMNTVEKIRGHIESLAPPADRSSGPGRKFTVSIGLSVYTAASTSGQELLQQADKSLFQAKMAGRNTSLLWTRHLITDHGQASRSSTVNT
jgi:diguanylate cyclase (GGDEF)-like protein